MKLPPWWWCWCWWRDQTLRWVFVNRVVWPSTSSLLLFSSRFFLSSFFPNFSPFFFSLAPSTVSRCKMLERTNLRPGTSSRSIVFIPFLRSLLLSGGVPPLDERRHSRELIEPFHSTRRLTIEPFQSFQRLLVVRARVFIQKKKRRKNEATIEGTIEVSPRRSFLLYRGTIDDTWIEGRYRNSSIHILPPWLEKRTDRKVKWRLVLVDRSAPRVPLSYARVSPHLWTSTRSLIHTGTSTCSHAVCPVHTRILRWRGGEGVARQLQHHRCCCCLQSGVLYCQPCRGLANAIHRASRSCCASVRQSTISLSSFSPLFVRYTPPHRLLSCVSWRRADLLRRSHCFPYVRDSNRDWSMVQITRKSKPLVCNSRCLRISARLLSRECRSIEDFFKDRRGIWII